jgi:hypothetical protein
MGQGRQGIGREARLMPNELSLPAIDLFAAMPPRTSSKSLSDQLVGTWNLISQEQLFSDGRRRLAFGPESTGINVYTPDGRFCVLFVQKDLPKIAARDRTKATVEEAKAIVAGSIGYFGSYAVNEMTNTIVYRVEGTTFANMFGVQQRRAIIVLTAHDLKYRNPDASTCGQIEVSLRRASQETSMRPTEKNISPYW